MDVHVNAAMSVDGKLSTRHREQIPISGEADFARVDRLRVDSDAVLVGIGTVHADDPTLGIANGGGARSPTRVVIDSRARTPTDAAVLDDRAPTVVVVAGAAPAERVDAIEDAGASVIRAGADRVDMPEAISALHERGLHSILVEGGGEIIFSLFEADLVDRLTVFVGSVIIGGRDAPTLADGDGFGEPAEFPSLSLDGVDRLDDGVVLSYST